MLVIGFLVTAALGLPLAFTLALTSATYLVGIGGVSLTILPIKLLGGVDSFVLLAIPLFILAGALMESGAISERIVDLAMAIVGRVRGGLAMVVVVAEVLFSGISGSTAADVSAISSLLVPSMRKAGYSGAEAVSVVAAASAMGILVPPCLTMVVLGSLVNLSIVTLFLAGFLPAFLLAAHAARPDRGARAPAGLARGRAGRRRADLGRAARRAIVPLGLPVLLFGGIFTGITTVTEAALVAVVYALVVGIATGGIGAREPRPALRAQRRRHRHDALGAGRGLGLRVDPRARVGAPDARRVDHRPRREPRRLPGPDPVRLRGDRRAPRGAAGAPDLRARSCSRSAAPLGVDPVHYGIVIVAAMGIAFFLPPVGVGLSIASGIARVDVDEVSRSYLPYLLVLLVGLALIAAFPGLTLVLPRLILGYRG